MAIKNSTDFTIDCKGELTGNQYTGSFTCRTKLSMREALAQDELYRRILGVNSQDASNSSKSIAAAVSYLSAHVMKSPPWWEKLDSGLQCEDINLLTAVNNACMDAVEKEYLALAEEAKKAETALKDLPVT
jgi:hypothetical protein